MTLTLLLPIVGVFACVAVATAYVANLILERSSPEQRRLRAVAPSGSTTVFGQVQLADTPDPVLLKLSQALPKSPKDMTRLRRRLAMAGLNSFRAAVIFSFAEIVTPVVCTLAVLVL